MPATALLKVQTGPVRDFVDQARSSRELWAGSWLLSHLTRTGASAVRETPGAELLYPALESPGDPLEAGMPNFFVARLPAESAASVGRSAEDAIRAEWRRIADAVRAFVSQSEPSGWDADWDRQMGLLPAVDWIVHPCPEDATALRLLAKGVPPLPEGAPDYAKSGNCLEGLHLAAAEWKFAALRNSGPFAGPRPEAGVLNLIKRHFPEAYLRDELGWRPFSPSFDSVAQLAAGIDAADAGAVPGSPAYCAVLAMDGDDMGRWFAGCRNGPGNLNPLRPGYQGALAHRLAAFADRASGMVSQYVGQAVYCGGDGVLALLPASSALPCADELAKSFSRALPGASASVGIAFAPVCAPLQETVQAARAALAAAKSIQGKDAFCLRIFDGSGGHADFAARWRSGVVKVWRDLEDRKGELSHRFAQRFAERLRRLLGCPAGGQEGEWTEPLREAALLELVHGIHRQTGLPREDAEALAQPWHQVLTRLSPRDCIRFWLAWAFLRRMEEPAGPSNADE